MTEKALVIVHLSSLDAFTFEAGETEGFSLAEDIAGAIIRHKGPVIIVDQGWPLQGDESVPRQRLLEDIQGVKGIIWIRFDEETQDWDPFLRKLRQQLRNLNVRKVTVGGVWYNPNLKSGCATEVFVYLRQFFEAKVDESLVGCEE